MSIEVSALRGEVQAYNLPQGNYACINVKNACTKGDSARISLKCLYIGIYQCTEIICLYFAFGLLQAYAMPVQLYKLLVKMPVTEKKYRYLA